jgi:hypothetical protein
MLSILTGRPLPRTPPVFCTTVSCRRSSKSSREDRVRRKLCLSAARDLLARVRAEQKVNVVARHDALVLT